MFRIERDRVKFSDISELHITEIDAKASSEPAVEIPDPYEGAREKAIALLETASNESDNMKRRAKEQLQAAENDAERLRDEARREGYEQGFNQGFEEGRAEGEQIYGAMIRSNEDALANTLAEIKQAGDTMISDMESDIIDLCFSVLRKITALDKATDGEIYKSIIKKAISQVDLTGRVTVRLPHEDFERFFPSGTVNFEINDTTVTANIVSDPEFAEGDIAVDTDSETVIATAETQLHNIEVAFKHSIGRDK